MNAPAVFLDKDGTLIADVPYNVDPAQIRLLPGASEGARILHNAGYRLVVVTNQSGVARGLFPESALVAVEARLRSLLNAAGVPLAGFYYCPHHPEGSVPAYAVDCDCRKPAPGLLLRAARERQLDLARSWMIGDILHDVEAGHRAGCRAALIDNGGETEWLPGPHRAPDLTAPDLATAARRILNAGRIEPPGRQERQGNTRGSLKEKIASTDTARANLTPRLMIARLRISFASFASFAFLPRSVEVGRDG